MFGLRVDPITGAANSGHTGIDIAPGGSAGVVNVIASKDGIVTKVINNCVSLVIKIAVEVTETTL